ncbi:MAG: gamma-glutamyl-gamma-aminobutyrate hydrolase family protein, partial [Alphaproteobacteria bacterium]|nr:gamma-glutamyl-gamma-aminobutyrate hydrolase family protein [Alphaproteobacteria bacterium]
METLYLETYPTEHVKVWAVTAKTVTDCIKKGEIPQIRLPEEITKDINSSVPRIAVLLGQDKHPDREEKDLSIFPDYVDAIINSGGFPVFIAFDKVEEQLEIEKPDGILLVGGNFRLIRQEGCDYEPRPLAYIKLIEYAKANKLPVFAICG